MVDPECVRTKLGALEESLRGLAEKQDRSEVEYLDSRDLRDVVERRFVTEMPRSGQSRFG